MPILYSLIRSKRRTIAIQIDTFGDVIVRSPLRTSISYIENFLHQKDDWVKKNQMKQREKNPKKILSESEIVDQKKILKNYIIPRVYELWEWKNLPKITSIKITKSESRWGSCSARNWLCFSYRLAEYLHSPFLDAIIIHEIAHLREKNHQKPFWDLVNSWMPEYKECIKDTEIQYDI